MGDGSNSHVCGLNELWELQRGQQSELGLDPRELNDVERRRVHGDLINQLYEEVAELAATQPQYKRHLLVQRDARPIEVAEEVADVLKCVIAVAQLHGLTQADVLDGFRAKTRLISERARQERVRLHDETLVLATDLDDVICDLSDWRRELDVLEDVDHTPARRLEASESMKNSFYVGGRFRDMKPIDGAVDALSDFKAARHKIVIVTARPQWQYKRLYADTVWWLERHSVPYDLLLFARNKVEAICQHVCPAWPRAMVEDHEGNARALADAGVPVLLFDRPHNRRASAWPGVERVGSWSAVKQRMGV